MKGTRTRFIALLLALCMVLALSSCGATESSSATSSASSSAASSSVEEKTYDKPEITIDLAHMFAEGDPIYVAVLEGKAYIEEQTHGRICLNVYPGGSYGQQANGILAVRMGNLDIFHEAFNTNYVEAAGAIQGPFLFADYAAWDKFEKSDYCKELVSEIEAKAGYHIMGIGHFGFREFLSTSECRTVDDFSKIKMRVVDSPAYRAVATVLGATGTPINITDVYMSLQTGVVQATENPLGQLTAMKFYEVAKYLEMTNHMIAQNYWIVSDDCYSRLSAEDQALLKETLTLIADRTEEIVEAKSEEYISTMKAAGVTVIDDLDRQQFLDRLPLVFEEFPAWKAVYEKIQG